MKDPIEEACRQRIGDPFDGGGVHRRLKGVPLPILKLMRWYLRRKIRRHVKKMSKCTWKL